MKAPSNMACETVPRRALIRLAFGLALGVMVLVAYSMFVMPAVFNAELLFVYRLFGDARGLPGFGLLMVLVLVSFVPVTVLLGWLAKCVINHLGL